MDNLSGKKMKSSDLLKNMESAFHNAMSVELGKFFSFFEGSETKYKSKVNLLKKERGSLQGSIEELGKMKEALNGKVSETEMLVKEKVNKIADLEGKVEQMEKSRELMKKMFEHQKAQIVSTHAEEIKNFKEKYNDIVKTYNEECKKREETEQDVKNLSARLRGKELELEKLIKETEIKIEKLQTDIVEWKKKMDIEKKRGEDLEVARKNLQNTLAEETANWSERMNAEKQRGEELQKKKEEIEKLLAMQISELNKQIEEERKEKMNIESKKEEMELLLRQQIGEWMEKMEVEKKKGEELQRRKDEMEEALRKEIEESNSRLELERKKGLELMESKKEMEIKLLKEIEDWKEKTKEEKREVEELKKKKQEIEVKLMECQKLFDEEKERGKLLLMQKENLEFTLNQEIRECKEKLMQEESKNTELKEMKMKMETTLRAEIEQWIGRANKRKEKGDALKSEKQSLTAQIVEWKNNYERVLKNWEDLKEKKDSMERALGLEIEQWKVKVQEEEQRGKNNIEQLEAALQYDISLLRAQLELEKKKVEELQEELERERSLKENLEGQMVTLETKLKDCMEIISDRDSEVRKLNEDILKASEVVDRLRREGMSLEQRNAYLEREVVVKSEVVNSLEKKVGELKESVGEKEALNERQREHLLMVSQAVAQMCEKGVGLEVKTKCLEREVMVRNEELEALERKVGELSRTVVEKEALFNRQKEELLGVVEGMCMEGRMLEVMKRELEMEVVVKGDKVNSLGRMVEELSDAIVEKEAQNDKQTQQIQMVSQAVEEMCMAGRKLEVRAKQLERELSGKNEVIQSLEKKVEVLGDSIVEKEAQKDRQSEDLKKVAKVVEEMCMEGRRLEGRAKWLEREVIAKNTVLSSLEKRLEELSGVIVEKEAQFDREKGDLLRVVDVMCMEGRMLEVKRRQLETEVVAKSEVVDSLGRRVEELSGAIVEKEAQNNKQTQQLLKVSKVVEEMCRAGRKLEVRAKHLEREVIEKEALNKKQKQDLKMRKKQVQTCEEVIFERNSEVQRLNDNVLKLAEAVEQMSVEGRHLEVNYKRKVLDLERLNVVFDSLTEKYRKEVDDFNQREIEWKRIEGEFRGREELFKKNEDYYNVRFEEFKQKEEEFMQKTREYLNQQETIEKKCSEKQQEVLNLKNQIDLNAEEAEEFKKKLAEMENLYNSKCKQLQDLEFDFNHELTTVKGELETTRKKSIERLEQLLDLRKRLIEVQDEADKSKTESQAEISKLEKQLGNAKEETERLKRMWEVERVSLEEKIKQLQAKLEEEEENHLQYKEMQDQICLELRRELDKVKLDCADFPSSHHRIAELVKQYEELDGEVALLKRDKLILQERIEELEEELRKVRQGDFVNDLPYPPLPSLDFDSHQSEMMEALVQEMTYEGLPLNSTSTSNSSLKPKSLDIPEMISSLEEPGKPHLPPSPVFKTSPKATPTKPAKSTPKSPSKTSSDHETKEQQQQQQGSEEGGGGGGGGGGDSSPTFVKPKPKPKTFKSSSSTPTISRSTEVTPLTTPKTTPKSTPRRRSSSGSSGSSGKPALRRRSISVTKTLEEAKIFLEHFKSPSDTTGIVIASSKSKTSPKTSPKSSKTSPKTKKTSPSSKSKSPLPLTEQPHFDENSEEYHSEGEEAPKDTKTYSLRIRRYRYVDGVTHSPYKLDSAIRTDELSRKRRASGSDSDRKKRRRKASS